MAKAKTKVVAECCGPSAEYKPRMYLNLDGQDTSQVQGLKVGDEVELVVTGTVVGLNQSERTDSDGKARKTGSIDLEDYRVKVMGEDENEFDDDQDD